MASETGDGEPGATEPTAGARHRKGPRRRTQTRYPARQPSVPTPLTAGGNRTRLCGTTAPPAPRTIGHRSVTVVSRAVPATHDPSLTLLGRWGGAGRTGRPYLQRSAGDWPTLGGLAVGVDKPQSGQNWP